MIPMIVPLFWNSSSTPRPTDGLNGIELGEAIFHNLQANQKVPAMSVTVTRKGETLFSKGYGFLSGSSREKVDPCETLFRTASIAKCITGLALGKMQEQGILDLDDSFYTHVPDYPRKQFDFTLKMLAGHTAGIRTYKGREIASNRPLTIQEGTGLFSSDPLAYIPGSDFLYTSYDFVLLSLAMQNAAGMPFEDYVRQEVLMPLGMLKTIPEPRKKFEWKPLKGKVVSFYTRSGSGFRRATSVNNHYKMAGGGYLSTSEDIARLGHAIFRTGFLKQDTLYQILQPQLVLGKSTYYGLGWQVSYDINNRHYLGHVGNSVGAYTNFYVYPEQGMVFSILINSSDPRVQPELDEAINAVLSAR